MSVRKPTRGVLYVISGFLFLSVVVRLMSGASEAIAEGSNIDPTPSDQAPASTMSPEFDVLLSELNAREAVLIERENALENRLQALRVAETEISARLEELRAAEESLAATIAQAEVAAENDLAALTAVYENMKPADAAALFQEMTPDFAAGFLGRMRSDSAAAIMSGLDPVHAYSISVLLAGRNVNVPTE